MSSVASTSTLLPEPRIVLNDEVEDGSRFGAVLRLRDSKCPRTVILFRSHSGVVLCVGPDDRPSALFIAAGLSPRAALEVLHVLAVGCEPDDGQRTVLGLEASPRAWVAIRAALGRICARLTPFPDEALTLPPLVA